MMTSVNSSAVKCSKVQKGAVECSKVLKLPDSNQFYKKIVGRVEFELKYKIINKKKKTLESAFFFCIDSY